MNILIVADRLDALGGAESHVITQVNEFLKRNHNVFLTTNAITQYYLDSIKPIRENQFQFVLWSENYIQDILNNNFFPTLVHSHPYTGLVRALEISKYFNVPLFYTVHGYYSYGVDKSSFGYEVSEKASKIICVDEGVNRLLQNCTPYPAKLTSIYNGIDLTNFYPTDPDKELLYNLDINTNWPTLMTVCRFSDGKQLPLFQLMECAPALADYVGGLNIILVGSGNYAEQVYNTNTEAISKCNNLILYKVGFQTEIRRYLSLADLVLACGRAAIEAMACKKSVFITYQNFAGVVTKNNFKDTLLSIDCFRNYSNEELIITLGALLKNKDLLNQYAQENYEIAIEHCDIQKNTDKLERLYMEVVG